MPGLYIHMPFCTRKCFYCDFYSIINLGLIDNYTDALCREIELTARELTEQKLSAETVFIGGGTPSLLTPRQMDKIFDSLHKYFHIAANAEISVECNPGTNIIGYLDSYRRTGINRLSIGVQSFVEEELKFLQRIHNSEEAANTVRAAQEAGFDNINIDLIFAIPGQTRHSLDETITKALGLNISHIAYYSLIYEEGTPLFREFKNGRVKKIDENLDAELYYLLIDRLTKAGYEQYEVSNFAKKGKKCRHNLNYWYGGDYIAFGPSAHGFLDGKRYWNYRNLVKYLECLDNNRLPVEGEETLTKEDRLSETIFLQMRAQGLKLEEFHLNFGFDILTALKKLFSKWHDAGLVKLGSSRIAFTPEGYSIGDELCLKIIMELERKTDLIG